MAFLERLKALFGGRRNGDSEGIACEDALRLVHEFLDGELEDVSEAEVAAHFDVCQRCYPHLRMERSFRQAVLRAAGREAAPPELQERLVTLIEQARSEG